MQDSIYICEEISRNYTILKQKKVYDVIQRKSVFDILKYF